MVVSCMRNASGHYRNSSFIVDVAMGQIPRSTERLSSYYYYSYCLQLMSYYVFCRVLLWLLPLFTSVSACLCFSLGVHWILPKARRAVGAREHSKVGILSSVSLLVLCNCAMSCGHSKAELGRAAFHHLYFFPEFHSSTPFWQLHHPWILFLPLAMSLIDLQY